MGGGIAMSFADTGCDVCITDATKDALDRGMARIKSNYETSVKRGSLKQDEMERRFARIHPVPSIDDLADCDVIIEAAFEQIPVKEEIFKKLDAVMAPGEILFSTPPASTSTSWPIPPSGPRMSPARISSRRPTS